MEKTEKMYKQLSAEERATIVLMRCGHIMAMQSIHLRPPEVADRLIPGHWEADMIKDAMNRSSVGTLVERTTLMVVLVQMPDGTAQSALDGFSEALSAISPELRKTFTYDQGREMSKHAQPLSEPAWQFISAIHIARGSGD